MKKVLQLVIFILISSSVFSQLDENQKKEFNKLIRTADLLFAQSKFLDAKKVYESALSLNSKDTYAAKQLEKCLSNEHLLTVDKESKSYQKIILKGDEKFNSADYPSAKEYFERALTFKPNDPYPKKRLAEIEDLMNPKPIKKTEPLPDLGIGSDLSIVDAEKLLKQADLERKNKQNNSVKNENTKIERNEEERILNRTKESQVSSSKMAETQKKIEANAINTKAQQDSLNLAIQNKENSLDTRNSNDIAELKEINLTTSGQLTRKSNQVDSVSIDSKYIGFTNPTALYQKEKKATDSLFFVDIHEAHHRNINDRNLEIFAHDQEKKVNDNTESQKNLSELVLETNLEVEKKENELTEKKVKNANSLVENVNDIQSQISIKDLEDAKNGLENNVGLNESKKVYNAQTDSLYKSPENKLLENKKQFNYQATHTIDSLNTHNEELKKNYTVQVQANEKVITNEEQNKLRVQEDNRITLVSDLHKKKQDNSNLEEINKVKQEQTAEKLKEIDKKTLENEAESVKKESEEKFHSKDKINTLETKVISSSSENKGIASENASSINAMNNSLNGSQTMDIERQNSKNLESRSFVENIERKTIQFDEKAANSIGSLYPEGVSQEQFNKTDEAGSVIAVVTRRVVVKSGYGQIYTRTQTLNAITYSKNGLPSTEFVWQRETQDAKLKKN
jgi:epidermal growth factor receptor substrate 15